METMEKLFGADAPSNSVAAPEIVPEAPVQQPEASPPPAAESVPAAIYGDQQASEAPSEAAPAIPPGYVPIQAMLDERDKRQQATKDAERYREQVRNFERQKDAPKMPDPIADPEGHASFVARQIAEAEWRTTVKVSERLAVREYGADAVKAAKEAWIEKERANPALAQLVSQQEDPIDFVVKEYRRQQALARIGDKDLDTFIREEAAKLNPVPPAAPGLSPVAAPATLQPAAVRQPPRSIASETAASGPRTGYEPSPTIKRLFG